MHRECAVARDGDAIHGYVAGTLPPHEMEEFEIHLLECEACQAAVREGAAVAAALGSEGPRRIRRPLVWAALAVAAGLAALLLRPADPLKRLGAVPEAPPFRGLAVRTAADSSARLAGRGMEAYASENWVRAAELLAAAAELKPAPGLAFFRGVSLLMTGDAEAALGPLKAAMEPPSGPYAPEAGLYLGKALLQLGRGEEALGYLDGSAAAGVGAAARHAGALADSVREVLRR